MSGTTPESRWLVFKLFALSISGLLVLASLPFLRVLPMRLDPQGRTNGNCFSEALPSLPNGNGLVVSGHTTYCDFPADMAVYVYLHEVGERDTSRALILRYVPHATSSGPTVKWIDARNLSITTGDVVQITKVQPSLEGVAISYSIGKEEFSRAAWDARVSEMKMFGVGLYVFTISMIVVFFSVLHSLGKDAEAHRL